ncbi:MAG: hypothetical protein PHI12_07035 [Dehalococcoidales bacterium]|nr:hypothetical protein [Dehalococcoidales bacterium]
MFYEEDPQQTLRFGDIVRGYVSGTPAVNEPNLDPNQSICTLKLAFPLYYAVMTPCCSIGEGTISLAPLLPIKYNFFQNPYFVQDLTNINRTMSPEQAVAPEVWKGFPEEVKQERLMEGDTYALVAFFIYEKHALLAEYPLGKKTTINTGYYLVDFRTIYQLECKKVQNPKDCPWESKILEMTIPARNELRDKLASYYQKRPKEDLVMAE